MKLNPEKTHLLLRGFSVLLLFAMSAVPAWSADPEVVAAIKKAGGIVRPMTGSSEDLKVEFQLTGRGLTDKGLAQVAALKNVVRLNLRGTQVTSAGLVHIKGLTKLGRLHLEKTPIDDAGIENLAGLVNLEYLNLYGTKITDKALAHLVGLKKLRQLYVWQTGVTDEGVAMLAKALPELRIVRGVDLSKIVAVKAPPPRPSEPLKWLVFTEGVPPRSVPGSGTEIHFLNKSDKKVKLFWVEYNGSLRLYGELDPNGKRNQNTFSQASWLVTDVNDKPLGYFRTTQKVGKATIPK